MKKYGLPLLLICLCLICACAQKSIPVGTRPATPEQLADLRDFPQNLAVYANAAGASKRLVGEQAQSAMASRFERIYFGPWHMRKTSISRRSAQSVFGSARGYKDGAKVWTGMDWEAMRGNAGFERFPSRSTPAITLRSANLRELPTDEQRFSEPTPDVNDNPFDYFQYSALAPGMPLLIAHTSNDGRWHYVECPIAGGWVNARDVAPAPEDFRAQWLTGRYVALIKDNVALGDTGAKAGIGAILPLVGSAPAGYTALAPARGNNGEAIARRVFLDKTQAVIMPMPLTPGNVARVGNVLMGQRYGWGGMLGLRDCSAMLRDLMTPFGLWLPRNSRSQARSGSIISLAGMNNNEKEQTIIRDGVPFLSLVGMPGHITLYVGRYKNRAALFHNVWGLRIIKDDNDDERFVIGRAVITSITPGMELENLYRTQTFADRVKTLTNLAQ